jgi:hypothetical protein
MGYEYEGNWVGGICEFVFLSICMSFFLDASTTPIHFFFCVVNRCQKTNLADGNLNAATYKHIVS